jgi:hypothetical protein
MRMTIDQLRAAVRRTLRSYGIDEDELIDELASIADHHAAEESAAAVSGEG